MASLGTLAAGVAHEINNPLSYVLGSLDLGLKELHGLRERLKGEELEHVSGAVAALDSAREGAERVRNIVRDLMDFSRPAPPSADAADAVDIETILDATIRIAWNEIRHRARLVKRYAGIARVSGDEARLGQVFLNLVMNAAQAIDGDPSVNEISVSTGDEHGAAVIEISDTAAGSALTTWPYFRPVLHHQSRGRGGWSGSRSLSHDDHGTRRSDLRVEQARSWYHFQSGFAVRA